MPYSTLNTLEQHTDFIQRHIGPDTEDVKAMLATIKADSIEDLINSTVPDSIRIHKKLNLGKSCSEQEALAQLKQIASENTVNKSYIGMGYYDTLVPAVIQRNVLENPGWYTAYTPYQPEISQGRLEGLLNFQQMIMDLTGMSIANASLLDEATAAAEAKTALTDSKPINFLLPKHSILKPLMYSKHEPNTSVMN